MIKSQNTGQKGINLMTKLSRVKTLNVRIQRINMPQLRWPLRLILYLVTIIMAVITIVFVYLETIDSALTSMVYSLAAVIMALSVYYLYHDINYVVYEKLKVRLKRIPFTNRLAADYRYRTVVFTYTSLSVNLIYALANGIYGYVNRSIWFGALSAYYIVLSIMRYITVRFDWRSSRASSAYQVKRKESFVLRNCGVLFILLTIALGAAVIQMVYSNKAHSYPGSLIFAVAAYTFYKTIMSVINVVKAGKLKSPLLMTIRHIGYADAVVSMLSLQTAMFVSFGSKDTGIQRQLNGSVGGIVCLMIFIMGIHMIYSANRQRERSS